MTAKIIELNQARPPEFFPAVTEAETTLAQLHWLIRGLALRVDTHWMRCITEGKAIMEELGEIQKVVEAALKMGVNDATDHRDN